MPEKDPSSYSLLTYLYMFVLASWGGIVGWLRKRKAGDTRPFNFTELIGEIVISAFVGLITFYLCEASEVSPLMTAVFVAVSGHMGTRLLFQLETVLTRRFGITNGPN